MNGEYFQNPIFPSFNTSNNNITPNSNNLYNDNSFDININNILKNNKNKKVKIYITKPNSNENYEISGIIEKSNNDNIIIYNPKDDKYYLIPTNKINYIIFEEKIN